MEANKKLFSPSYERAINAYAILSLAIFLFGDFVKFPDEMLRPFYELFLYVPTIKAKYFALQQANLENEFWPLLAKVANKVLLQFVVCFFMSLYLFLNWKKASPHNKSDFSLHEIKQFKKMLYIFGFFIFMFPLMIFVPMPYTMASIKNDITLVIPSTFKIVLGTMIIGLFIFIGLPILRIICKKQ